MINPVSFFALFFGVQFSIPMSSSASAPSAPFVPTQLDQVNAANIKLLFKANPADTSTVNLTSRWKEDVASGAPFPAHGKLVTTTDRINENITREGGNLDKTFKDYAASLMLDYDYEAKVNYDKANFGASSADPAAVAAIKPAYTQVPKSDVDRYGGANPSKNYNATWRIPENGSRFVLFQHETTGKAFYPDGSTVKKTTTADIEQEWLQYPYKMLKTALGLTLPEEAGDEQTIKFKLGDLTSVTISLDVTLHRADRDKVVFQCEESYVRLHAARESKVNGSSTHNQKYEMDYQMSIVSGSKEGQSKINKAMFVYNASGPVSTNQQAETQTPSDSRTRAEVISTVHRFDEGVLKLLANMIKSSGDRFQGDIVVLVKGKLYLPIRASLKSTLETFTQNFLVRAILNKGAMALAVASDAKAFASFVAMMLPRDIRLSKIDDPKHNYFHISATNPADRKYQTMLQLGSVPLRTAISVRTVPLLYTEANLRFSVSFTLTRSEANNIKKRRTEAKVTLLMTQAMCQTTKVQDAAGGWVDRPRKAGTGAAPGEEDADFGFIIKGVQWSARKSKYVPLMSDIEIAKLNLASIKMAVKAFAESVVEMLEQKKASLNFIKAHVLRYRLETGCNLAIAVGDTTVQEDLDEGSEDDDSRFAA